MKATARSVDVSKVGIYFMVALRILIGWHFLYEGLIKLGDPTWTAAGYLEQSRYILPGLFHWMADSQGMLAFIDFANIWGQIFIGLGLMLGLFTRIAAIGGAVLLGMYFLANPPFITNAYSSSLEGHYLFIDKNLIECIAMIAVALLPTGHYLGLDKLLSSFIYRKKSPRKIVTPEEIEKSQQEPEPVAGPLLPRREILKHLATLPVLGAFGLAYLKKRKWESMEEQNLVDIMSGASVVRMDFPEIDELKGELPFGMIRDKQVSKVILGGNLLNGYAHSRDLIYVSHLIRAYHTKERIFRTLSIAEKCGVNTLLTDPVIAKLINEYWDRKLGKIQFMSDCVGLDYSQGVRAKPFQEWLDFIQQAIDHGATACYIQGETADFYFQQEDGPDKIAKALQLIEDAGLPAGIGAHNIETIKKAADLGFDPDFWMKTIHHQQYWSAQHPTWHDNKFCFNTEETIAFMNDLPQPWIGFKILAAGAIHPEEGFRFAFEGGADFICVGMYDFQMVQDVNIALDCLNDPAIRNRKRPWRA
ncbi:MAG: DoxX family protein [Bacteroidales bacterium]|nr:DoxX family protein [Bacteroidales bacterium]